MNRNMWCYSIPIVLNEKYSNEKYFEIGKQIILEGFLEKIVISKAISIEIMIQT